MPEATDDLVDDVHDLLRLQTHKRGRGSWTFALADLAADLRVDEDQAADALVAFAERDSCFGIAETEEGYVAAVGGPAGLSDDTGSAARDLFGEHECDECQQVRKTEHALEQHKDLVHDDDTDPNGARAKRGVTGPAGGGVTDD